MYGKFFLVHPVCMLQPSGTTLKYPVYCTMAVWGLVNGFRAFRFLSITLFTN
jgi:hypothetical protein